MPQTKTSKKELIARKLKSKNGATLANLIAITNWQEHSVRSTVSTIRKSGTNVTCSKRDGKPSIYQIITSNEVTNG